LPGSPDDVSGGDEAAVDPEIEELDEATQEATADA
jgi:hypothetical protein